MPRDEKWLRFVVITWSSAELWFRRTATSTIGQEPIKLWDTTSWEETANLEVHGAILNVTGFLPDGNTLVGFDSRQRVLHLWRAPSWEEIAAAEAKEKAEIKEP